MCKSKLYILIFVLVSMSYRASGQQPVVDRVTGRLQMLKSLYGLQLEGKAFPVTLSYSTGGLQAGSVGGFVGEGWSISLQGNITREVHDLPDDYSQGSRQGWLIGTVAQQVNGFTPGSMGCASEPATWQSLEAFKYKDTQPDEFSINFMGIRGKFLFDANGQPHFSPYQDLEIEFYDTNGSSYCASGQCNIDGPIERIDITDNEGYKYSFEVTVEATKGTTAAEGIRTIYAREYNLYQTGIDYNSAWYLSQVTSPSGEYMKFFYHDIFGSEVIESNYGRDYYVKYNADYWLVRAHSVNEAYQGRHLKEVAMYTRDDKLKERLVLESMLPSNKLVFTTPYAKGSNGKAYLLGSNARLEKIRIYKRLEKPKREVLTHDFHFDYKEAGKPGLWFLSQIAVKQGTWLKPIIKFDYHLVDDAMIFWDDNEINSWGYFDDKDDTTVRMTAQQYIYVSNTDPAYQYSFNQDDDYGGDMVELPGGRKNSAMNRDFGTLKGIEYAGGSYTQVTYENNTYYDPITQERELGPGVRVKQITYYKMKADRNMDMGQLDYIPRVMNYVYEDAGTSSGVVINMPQYAYRTNHYKNPLTGAVLTFDDLIDTDTLNPLMLHDEWKYLTLRATFDLNARNDSYILYNKVIERTPGQGRIEYTYDIPVHYGVNTYGDYFEASSTTFYRNTCESLGYMSNGSTYTFPYGTNMDFSFANGLLHDIKVYREDNVLLRQTIYTYAWLKAAYKLEGLQINRLAGTDPQNPIKAITPYVVICDTRKIVDHVETRRYDEQGSGNYITSEQDYTYDPSTHLLRNTEVKRGEISQITEYRYSSDYSGASLTQGNEAGRSIAAMLDKHMKAVVIEQVNKIKYPDNAIKTLNGNLTKFRIFDGYIRPYESYAFNEVQQGDISWSAINSHNFNFDESLYRFTGRYLNYHSGQAGTLKDALGTYSGSHWGYFGADKVASISYGRADQVIYSGFDTETPYDFEVVGDTDYTVGFSATGLTIGSGKLRKIGYNLYGEHEFILTCYVKPSVQTNVRLKIKEGSTILFNQVKTVTDIDNWNELRWQINLNGAVGPSINIELSSNNQAAIDEVVFKPTNTYVNTTTYDERGLPVAVLDNNNRAAFTTYDEAGRPVVTRDKDRNIVSMQLYKKLPEIELNPSFMIKGETKVDQPIKFECEEEEYQQSEYYWTFGENAIEVQGNREQVHSFDTSGYYQVRLRLTHPTYGTYVYTRIVKVES